jgi:hypothetical protein
MITQSQHEQGTRQRAQVLSATAMLKDAMEATPEATAPETMVQAAKALGWSDETCETISNLFGRVPSERLRGARS